jgi:hypothetical protein
MPPWSVIVGYLVIGGSYTLKFANTVPITMVRVLSGADCKYCFGQPMLTTLEGPVTHGSDYEYSRVNGRWCSDRLGQNGVEYFKLRISFF